jgi:hypothetical protein
MRLACTPEKDQRVFGVAGATLHTHTAVRKRWSGQVCWHSQSKKTIVCCLQAGKKRGETTTVSQGNGTAATRAAAATLCAASNPKQIGLHKHGPHANLPRAACHRSAVFTAQPLSHKDKQTPPDRLRAAQRLQGQSSKVDTHADRVQLFKGTAGNSVQHSVPPSAMLHQAHLAARGQS